MVFLDKIFIGIAVVAPFISGLLAVRYWYSTRRGAHMDFDHCISDIRAMNTYNSYMLAGTMIFLGFAIDKGSGAIPNMSLVLILCSFLSASIAIFFFPVKKPKNEGEPIAARNLWLNKLIPTQWTVIFAVLGISNAVVSRLFN